MNTIRRALGLLLAAAVLLPAAGVRADDDYPKKGVSIGPMFNITKPDDSSSDWVGSGGLQMRVHMSHIWALEGAASYHRRRLGDTRADIYPVQASLMAYLFPNPYHISPYVLAGAGWYFTHLDSPNGSSTSNRFGPHVGAGVELFFNDKWSIDADYRHFWVDNITAVNSSLLNKDFKDDSHQVTAALNYRF